MPSYETPSYETSSYKPTSRETSENIESPYEFKVDHRIPNIQEYIQEHRDLDIYMSYSSFIVDFFIYSSKTDKHRLTFRINGYYYGETNSVQNITIDFKNYDGEKEKLNKILLDYENQILQVLETSMKDCVFNDHIRIYELLINEF